MRPLHELLIEAANRQNLRPTTRRGVLTLAGAAASVPAALGIESVLAQVNAEKKSNRQKANQRRRQRQAKSRSNSRRNDIAILNYALTLEHLEDAFYEEGVQKFGRNGFPFLGDIADHEAIHVEAISDTIEDLGGNPVERACYDFGFGTNLDTFKEIAQVLENTGVRAYDGAIKFIKSGDLQEVGARIATVEARHASYLNNLNGDNPFPDAFDTATPRADILDEVEATGFIVPCP